MQIITRKQEMEINKIKRENEFLKRGYRAIGQTLNYQNAIVSILKTLNIKEIEIDNSLLYLNQTEIEVSDNFEKSTTKIRLIERR